MITKISKSEFGEWKHHPITKLVNKYLRDSIKQIESDLANDLTIFSEGGYRTITRLSGVREGLNRVLNISIEDIQENDEENV